MRKVPFVEKEFYHIYNRGVDKRLIFSDKEDLQRFIQSIIEFNTIKPIGSIFENSFNKNKKKLLNRPLVQIIAYGLNTNHFHFILTQIADHGIEKFMQRLGGYTKYFNEKYSRSGSLFQGKFKANHINSNEYLLHASVYVNLNYEVHGLKKGRDLFASSWNEYMTKLSPNICSKEMILGQFKSRKKYEIFARSTLESILKRRQDMIAELENVAKNNNLEVQLPSGRGGR